MGDIRTIAFFLLPDRRWGKACIEETAKALAGKVNDNMKL